MAENPLIGKTLSLISKKNIRYLGTLYSINETNATVALQNVRSYGTEGREEDGKFVAPTDAVHPFLLFRGQDIKDLHVHEEAAAPENAAGTSEEAKAAAKSGNDGTAPPSQTQQTAAVHDSATPTAAGKDASSQSKSRTGGDGAKGAPATQSTAKPNPKKQTKAPAPAPSQEAPKTMAAVVAAGASGAAGAGPSGDTVQPKTVGGRQPGAPVGGPSSSQGPRRGRGGGRGGVNNRKVSAAPGTGASLLNRSTRGSNTNDKGVTNFQQDFDFQSNLEEFRKENNGGEVNSSSKGLVESPEGGEDVVVNSGTMTAYAKDDFFDSISNDASDRANGIDNRLRGREERSLNTETFGAVALNHSDYRRRGGRGGRGRGRGPYGGRWRGGGRYNSEGRGRGRSGGGRGGGRYSSSNGGFRGGSSGGRTSTMSSATAPGRS